MSSRVPSDDLQQPTRWNYADQRRHSLILCASLVQNPENLGGLCRLAEVFRLESLVLSRLAIAHAPSFRKTAVSAHHWQPLSECNTGSLPQWFEVQQHKEYTIVALDADPQAELLATMTFPEKTVLVLGRELTGIPNDVLARCDRRVTIPQYGLVESLNVQQAGAIAIYEYLRQHGTHGYSRKTL
jgi:tRNA guanosine-2'-O-methyltransferase